MSRPKRLYRVEAKDSDGRTLFRRDYQGERAATGRAIRLLDRGLVRYGGEDHSAYSTPVAAVTIQVSDVVTWPTAPHPYLRWDGLA